MRHFFCSFLFLTITFSFELFGAAGQLSYLKVDYRPGEIKKACNESISKANRGLGIIESRPVAQRNFKNTVVAIDEVERELHDDLAIPSFLNYVSTNKKIREASRECETKLDQYKVDLYLRVQLFEALKTIKKQKLKLKGEDKKLFREIFNEFKRNGLDLSPSDREELKGLKKELISVQSEFSNNIKEYSDPLLVTKQDLKGLPNDYISRLKRSADGRYIITLSYPDYIPFSVNALSGQARKKLQFKFLNRAADKNVALLERALQLREKISSMLGYKTHAHYVLEERLAKNPKKVQRFLKNLRKKLKKPYQKNLEKMLSYKVKTEKLEANQLYSWDLRFYDNLIKKEEYKVDFEKLKDYFPLDRVISGMFEIYQRLFHLRFVEDDKAPKWHPQVKVYQVWDEVSGDPIGLFYMDLFPRKGKYTHAAVWPLKGRIKLADGTATKSVGAIVANFNKPTKARKSLLKHNEVTTFFHEFGHVIHQILAKAQYGRFTGIATPWDFVEAPSQMLENWVWEKQSLQLMSGHYKNPKKKIPDSLLEALIASRYANSAYFYMRQIFYGLLDQTYHSGKISDTTAIYRSLYRDVLNIDVHEGTHLQAAFGHLMGYDAAYYGYLWSQVYSANMFERFSREGVLNPAVGLDYRRLILEPGGSEDIEKNVKKFIKGPVKEKPFLKTLGLVN